MEIISSGISIAPIGVTRDRAYLQVSVSLTSQHRYVAVVTTELAGLPEEVVDKLKHRDSSDAVAEKATFQVRVNAISAKIDKAAHGYERGKYDNAVRLLEGLNKEIDAVSAQYPKEMSKWMLKVNKSGVYCLLAASYKAQNEPEKSAKYEALFENEFLPLSFDLDLAEV